MPHSIKIKTTVDKSYSVIIGNDIWEDFLKYCRSSYSSRKLIVIIDANVSRLHGKEIEQQCSRYFEESVVIEIPEGEQSKSITQWRNLINELLENGIERSTPLLAVGGGVTGDLAGFVTASALRGIPLMHMPTSLLAMVDSSIGGKTGINHTSGKNLIGAFYQPDAVFAHLQFLDTLPKREWVNGLAEMLKYGAIAKPDLFNNLEQAVFDFTPNEKWKELITQCIKIKSEIVQKDVHEAGVRTYLNFGHTFGHALEKSAGFGTISHGEAVFVGMLAAVQLSSLSGNLVDMARFRPFKTLYDISLPNEDRIDNLIEVMYTDKKVKNESLHLILLKKWGEPVLKKIDNKKKLKEAWRAAFDGLKNGDSSIINQKS